MEFILTKEKQHFSKQQVSNPELVSFIWDDDGTGPDHGFPNPTLWGNYSAPNLPCPVPDQQDLPRAKGT